MRSAVLAAVVSFAVAASQAIVAHPPTTPPQGGPQAGAGPNAHQLYERGLYLDAYDATAGAVTDGDGVIATNWNLQQWLLALSRVDGRPGRFLGDAAPAAAGADVDLEGIGRRDALREVVERARGQQIVVLNEAHDNPQHRGFAIRVASALRPLGYATLAVEALFNDTSEAGRARAARLAAEGHPRLDAGYYTKEPVFGDLLRQGVRLGYRPIAYEQAIAQDTPGSGIAEREQAQAENILSQWRPGDPKNRLLVYVGYNHVAKRPIMESGELNERLAARLRRIAGVDVLAVDQATLSETSVRAEPRRWLRALRAAMPEGSHALYRDGRPFALGNLATAVDLQVYHRSDDRSPRPAWLRQIDRVSRVHALGPGRPGGCRLVQAFLAGEALDAVPVDMVLADDRATRVSMMVPPRREIRFVVQERTSCRGVPRLKPSVLASK